MTGSRIRCLFLLHDLACGGAERATLNLIRKLDRERFAPVLFVFKRTGEFIGDVPADVPIVVGHAEGQGFIAGRLRSLKVLLSVARESDVLIGSIEHQAVFFAAISSVLSSKPAIGGVQRDLGYFHSSLPPFRRLLYRAITNFFFQRLVSIVVVSRGVAASLADMLPDLRDRIRVIYNPIYGETVVNRSREALPDWAPQVFSKPVVIAVGRLENQKGFDLLIEAHARLKEGGNDHHLLIVGEGTQRASLSEIVRIRGVTQSVFMPGFCNPFPLMARSQIFALSSRFEGLPTVLIEAMTLGLPIVATRCPSGPEELLDNGRCGVLIRSEDVTELVTHLEQALRDPESVRPLALAARVMVENFDAATATTQWEHLLQTVAKDGNHTPPSTVDETNGRAA